MAGDRYTFLLTGAQTGGAQFAFEAFVPPGNGPPPHVHHREDEAFYILQGEFEFVVNGESFQRGPGESFFGPRDVPHHFTNVGTTPGWMIITTTPAGLEHFFAKVGTPLPNRHADPLPPSAEDIGKLIQFAPDYGVEIIGPGHP